MDNKIIDFNSKLKQKNKVEIILGEYFGIQKDDFWFTSACKKGIIMV